MALPGHATAKETEESGSPRIGLAWGTTGGISQTTRYNEVTGESYETVTAAAFGPTLGVELGIQINPVWAVVLRGGFSTLFLAGQASAMLALEWSASPRWSFASGLGWEAQYAGIGNMEIDIFGDGITIPAYLAYRFRDAPGESHPWVGVDIAAGAYDLGGGSRVAFTSHLGLQFGYLFD